LNKQELEQLILIVTHSINLEFDEMSIRKGSVETMFALIAGSADAVACAIAVVKLAGVGVTVGIAHTIGFVNIEGSTFGTF
jgi:hypothetical protein